MYFSQGPRGFWDILENPSARFLKGFSFLELMCNFQLSMPTAHTLRKQRQTSLSYTYIEFKMRARDQVCWHMLLIPALGRWR